MARGPFWYCNVCDAQNHELDGECQYCECGGPDCQRDNCSADAHFIDVSEQAAYERDRADALREDYGPGSRWARGEDY